MFWLTFPQRQYDVLQKKNFSYKLVHLSEPPPSINRNYNIKTNSNNNLKCIKIIKR